jgi:hypothetical protein
MLRLTYSLILVTFSKYLLLLLLVLCFEVYYYYYVLRVRKEKKM